MNLSNFAITRGNGLVKNNSIIYLANKVEADADYIERLSKNNLDLKKNEILFVKAENKFASGNVQFSFVLKSKNTGVLIVLKVQDGSSLICGPTLTEHKFAIAGEDEFGKWTTFKTAGNLSNYQVGQVINIKVQVEGSSVKLLINNIILCELNISIRDAPIEFRLCSNEDFEIYDIALNSSQQKLFVIMPFSPQYNQLYTDVIQSVAKEFDYDCVRGDEFYTGTLILKDITDSITKCSAIIADITTDNPNVFYEIGYSHAVGKPTILLCDTVRKEMPFDLSGFRTLYYENTIAGKNKVETNLRKYFENI